MGGSLVVTLIRHGQTKPNELSQYLGWEDVSLSEKGLLTIKSLAEKDYPEGMLYVCSDLKRCLETFRILYKDKNDVVHVTKGWREINFGDWELQTYEELKHQKSYRNWLNDRYGVTPPNGESTLLFEKRMLTAWQLLIEIAQVEGKNEIVIVTHGGPIQWLMSKAVPDEKEFFEWKPLFGEGYQFFTTFERVKEGRPCISYQEVPFRGKANG